MLPLIWFGLVGLGWVLWPVNHCWLLNAKSCFLHMLNDFVDTVCRYILKQAWINFFVHCSKVSSILI